MSNTLKLLIALVVALALGIVASVTKSNFILAMVHYVEPIGLVWIGFLKMVVIPLLIALLVTSVASEGKGRQSTPLLRRTIVVFVTFYTIMLLASFLLVPHMLQLLPSTLSLVTNESDAAAIAHAKPLSFIDQLLSWVPENPFKSATEGAILPVVIFSLFFGLALNHVAEKQKNTVLNFFQAVGSAMLKIVDWILIVAPLGIFCIVFPLASRVGAQMAGALGIYIFIHVAMYGLCIVLSYVLAAAFSNIALLRFVRACFQPQLIALGTQSSIASLPAMITASEEKLRLSPKLTNVVLPMAVSVFKAGTSITNVIYVLFIARMYHIEVTGVQWLTLFIVSFAAAVGGAGLPSGASFFAPILTIFTAMGLPAQGIPILFAMDTIPDMTGTAANVTADMAAVAITAKGIKIIEEQTNSGDENLIA